MHDLRKGLFDVLANDGFNVSGKIIISGIIYIERNNFILSGA